MEHEIIIEALSRENQELKCRLAVARMEATEEEKRMADDIFNELLSELSVLQLEINAVKISRDGMQSENQRLKHRIITLEKKLKG